MFVVWVVERLVMMSPPGFEVVCAADVLLHLLLPIHLGLHHHRLVDHVGDEALALEWAATHLLQLPPRAVASLGLWRVLHRNWRLDLSQDLPVVGGDDLLHVGHGGVGQLQVGPVEGLPQRAILGEALVDEGEEFGADVGILYILDILICK